jgi:hypothetical protein
VPGDPVGDFGGVERSLLGRKRVGESVKAGLQRIGDEDLVETRRQLVHGRKLRAHAGRSRDRPAPEAVVASQVEEQVEGTTSDGVTSDVSC